MLLMVKGELKKQIPFSFLIFVTGIKNPEFSDKSHGFFRKRDGFHPPIWEGL